jgi:ubiquinone/menaquinone biosynthesis C-methylase UbiE
VISTAAALPRLEDAVERLDAPGADPRLVAGSLDDLARINRLLLGTRLTLQALDDLLRGRVRGTVLELLDAGCGGGDMAAAMARWAQRRGFSARVTGVDASPSIAALAQERVGTTVDVRVGSMLALDLPDGGVDVAACSLVMHHLDPPDALRALRELRRVARVGVVVNDLVRTRVGLRGVHVLARAATRNPITRHDAVVSVRRAYTRAELVDLVREAGLRPIRVRGALGYRVAIAAVPE